MHFLQACIAHSELKLLSRVQLVSLMHMGGKEVKVLCRSALCPDREFCLGDVSFGHSVQVVRISEEFIGNQATAVFIWNYAANE